MLHVALFELVCVELQAFQCLVAGHWLVTDWSCCTIFNDLILVTLLVT